MTSLMYQQKIAPNFESFESIGNFSDKKMLILELLIKKDGGKGPMMS